MNLDKDLKAEKTEDIRNLYHEIDQYTQVRLKFFQSNNYVNNEKYFPSKITSNITDFEKIYSLFFIHPCLIKNILEGLSDEYYEVVWNGIKPFYQNIYKKMADTTINITCYYLISLFRILIEQDYIGYRLDLENLYNVKRPMIEFIISKFFEDVFYQIFNYIQIVLYAIAAI